MVREKIAFSFPSALYSGGEDAPYPVLIKIVPKNIDFHNLNLTIGVTNGFLNLEPKKAYALKLYVYKDGNRVFCSPNPDAGYVIENIEDKEVNGRVSAVSTDDVSILEQPTDGIYEIRVLLCDIANHDEVLDQASSFFELRVEK
ncbi:TPA: hypothetical protein ACSTL2_001226 [Morganella morganii]|nr:hypothetical protein [Morganella sp. (in: enterobacteria)]